MKIWFFISILFCLYSINILNEEKDYVIYKSINQSESYDYLICFDLIEEINILSNETSIDLLNETIYDHFNKLEYGDEETKKEDLERYKQLVLNRIKTKDYFILKGLLCLIRKNYDNDNFFFKPFFENRKFFIFKKKTYDLIKLNYFF